MTDRRVPRNPDAEAALISACLLYTDRRREALATLDPDDLYVAANRRVYAAIARLETRGEHRVVVERWRSGRVDPNEGTVEVVIEVDEAPAKGAIEAAIADLSRFGRAREDR